MIEDHSQLRNLSELRHNWSNSSFESWGRPLPSSSTLWSRNRIGPGIGHLLLSPPRLHLTFLPSFSLPSFRRGFADSGWNFGTCSWRNHISGRAGLGIAVAAVQPIRGGSSCLYWSDFQFQIEQEFWLHLPQGCPPHLWPQLWFWWEFAQLSWFWGRDGHVQ